MGALASFFDSSLFMPHGACILWRPDLVALHAVSDLLTALSYYSIPLALAYLAYKRPDIEFRWMFGWFVIFIVACGTTHLMGVWTLWVPDYALDGMIKGFTAVVSVITAIMLWQIMPVALSIPSKTALAEINRALEKQIGERLQAEEAVRELAATLEQQVELRTEELARANRELAAEVEERREIENSNRLLIDELNHRVKNTLTTCRSLMIASMTADRSPAEAVQAMEGRLQTLALAHDLLSESRWQGADLRELAHRELQAFAPSPDLQAIRISGPAARLDARSATAVVMTLHELATNAIKYGALSCPDGRIDLTWVLTGLSNAVRLVLTWQESGGPPVQSSIRSGFGRQLICGRIPYELGGDIRLEFRPEGVHCQMEVPLVTP